MVKVSRGPRSTWETKKLGQMHQFHFWRLATLLNLEVENSTATYTQWVKIEPKKSHFWAQNWVTVWRFIWKWIANMRHFLGIFKHCDSLSLLCAAVEKRELNWFFLFKIFWKLTFNFCFAPVTRIIKSEEAPFASFTFKQKKSSQKLLDGVLELQIRFSRFCTIFLVQNSSKFRFLWGNTCWFDLKMKYI